MEVHRLFHSFLRVLVISATSIMADVIIYTGDLPRYVLDRLFDNLTVKS